MNPVRLLDNYAQREISNESFLEDDCILDVKDTIQGELIESSMCSTVI